jgi:signal transduction histidine kinase
MRVLILITVVLNTTILQAQKQGQPLIDSLEHVLSGHRDDTARVRIYVQLTRAWDGINPRIGFPFAERGLELAQRLSWQQGIANLNNSLGLLTGDTGNNTQARVYFQKSLAINRTLGANASIIANLNNIGRSFERESDFIKASEYYFQGLELAQEIGNKELAALVGTNILSMYIEEQDYPKATAYVDSTIKWGKAAHALIHVAKAYEMMGVIRLNTADTSGARENYDTAIAIYQRLGNQMAVVSALSNLATLESDPAKAIDLTRKAQDILDTVAPLSQNSIMNLVNLGQDYLTLGEIRKSTGPAKAWALSGAYLAKADSLSRATKIITFEPDIQAELAQLAEDRGDYKTALVHYKREATLTDSIFSQESKNKIAKLESQRAIDLKNEEIKNEGLQISNQRKTMWMLVGGLALLGLIGVNLWRQGVTKKRTNLELVRLNAELNEANKVKAKFLGILSHDLRSPIARLLNFLQLQQRKPDSLSAAEKEEYWARLSGSATTLLETMEAMLLWSKGQMEVFQPRATSVEVGALFERLGRFFEGVPGVAFEFEGADGLTLETDEDYLWTIMQNLTANSVQALEKVDSPRVIWRAWNDGGVFYFRIKDNGPGVSEEYLRALYDETIGARARSGLGLHIIRDLAKAIGCRITTQSMKGVGTEFTLELDGRIPEKSGEINDPVAL